MDDFEAFTYPFVRYFDKNDAEAVVKQWTRPEFLPVSNDTSVGVYRGLERCSSEVDNRGFDVKPVGVDCTMSSVKERDSACPLCTWLEFYRDCFTSCYSRIHKEYFVIPVVLKSVNPGAVNPNDRFKANFQYVKNETDTSEGWDCGINPYARVERIDFYDCFGNNIDRMGYVLDLCGFYNFRYPQYRGYSRSETFWDVSLPMNIPLLPNPEQRSLANIDETIVNETLSQGRYCCDDKFIAARNCIISYISAYSSMHTDSKLVITC